MNNLFRQIEKVRKKEKNGPLAEWRKSYCKSYRAQLRQMQTNAHQALIERLAKDGKAITCNQGCTNCCYHYVTISLAQGIVIADFLYNDRELLAYFLRGYEEWRLKASDTAQAIDQQRNAALSSALPMSQILEKTRPLSQRYLEQHIRCPFLVENHCCIYPVRPTACSSHYAVSQPENCDPSNAKHPEIHTALATDEDLIKIVQLTDPRLSLYELSLPIMIDKLLTQGVEAVIAEIY